MTGGPGSTVIRNQILRSGTSVAAHYRAVCRARSKPEFISKIGVVVEEMDETLFWLEMISELNLVRASRLTSLMDEANQLTAIFVASRKTSRGV
ncbi:MAG: four helix bundle protein [Candidatus Koribacter versatilis]|uniref:Four helix bundle protein n=1 Tax=Candidatus Korobacter versatilis TaxID=658062 RepID=A0A932A9T5_9BACT|nr:four helix bundle protein [Candidatus Koribacter versatilis]